MDGNYRSLFITNRIVYVGSLNLSNIILYKIDMVFIHIGRRRGIIIVNDPMNPDNKVKAKLLKYEKTRGEDFEYQLKDGTKIQLKFDVNSIYRPIDESTGKPAVNSKTGEPVITINWGVRVNTIYSEKALSEFKVGSTTK